MAADLSAELRERIGQAAASRTPLRIVGGNSKAFIPSRRQTPKRWQLPNTPASSITNPANW